MTTLNIKLAIVTDVLPPWNVGGRETHLDELLPELARLGFDITVYTMRWWDEPVADKKFGDGYLRVRGICRPRPLYQAGRRSFAQAFVYAVACLRLLGEDFDIVETDPVPYFHLPVVWLVSKIRRKPLAILWWEVWGGDYWKEYLGRLGRLGLLFERVAVRMSDVTLAGSRRTYQQLADLGVRRERLVLTEPASRTICAEIRPGAPELLFVGRLLGHKRPDLAIGIVQELADVSVRLCIVGSGPVKEELEQQVREAHLEERVTFVARASEEELSDLIVNARVLVAPSEREGFGLVVAEALSVGTPVVTVDASTNASRELVIDGVTGRVCRTGDLEELSRAVRELLAHPLVRADVKTGWESLGIPKNYADVALQYLPILRQLALSRPRGRRG
jgi:glycosyltransferase involved in cell wall biosynthesis